MTRSLVEAPVPVELKVPAFPAESITEGEIDTWLKKVGDTVKADETIVVISTEKVAMEVPAPFAGVLTAITATKGQKVVVGSVLGTMESGAGAKAPAATPAPAVTPAPVAAAPAQAAKPAAADVSITPTARNIAEDKGIDPAAVKGSGVGGRVMKEDVVQHAAGTPNGVNAPASAQAPSVAPAAAKPAAPRATTDREERVRMTPLRRKVAERLLQAQSTAAILTTFNEVDMGPVMELRKRYQDQFVKKHGIKLGFMSLFVAAAVDALKAFPLVNAEIDGEDVIFKHYYDIGVAVAGTRGLVVPVVRDADQKDLAQLEKAIGDLGQKAKTDKLAISDLQGGTFTISNGGIFGSMMSTPILNPPQVAILGMHNIVDRAVVKNGQIVIAPMMYVALSYDHRIIDGKEAVQFLVRIKECIEDPQRLLLGV
jgi:2-oxoglutarate dehydrogenase E2 component (dihydrolipoamide succinyltransferase)